MAGREDIQEFIDRVDDGTISVEEVESDFWVITLESGNQLVVNYEPPVLVLRVNVMELPAEGPNRTALMQHLLELNATSLIHGSYGIEGGKVVINDTLQLEHLNFNEFQASVDSITLALASHMTAFAQYQG